MNPKTRIKWVLAGVLIIGLLLYFLRVVLVPVFFALVLAYILDPIIDRFEKRRIPRTVAIVIFVVGVLAIFAALVLLVAPMVQKELVGLAKNLPNYIHYLRETVIPWLAEHSGGKLPASLDEAVETTSRYVSQLPPEIIRPFANFVGKVLSNTAYILMGLLNLVIIPVFTFYFLRDFDALKTKAADLIPLPYREWTLDRLGRVDEVLGAFIRGQLTVCTILAVLYSLGLWLVGVDLAIVIGVIAGYLFIVPYLGTVVGVLAGSLMVLLEFHDFSHLLMVWVVFGVVQLLEGYIFTPKIVGSRVGLSPVSVILALLVGAGLFGLLGILIAVPAAAVLKIFAEEFVRVYRSSSIYTGEDNKIEASGEQE